MKNYVVIGNGIAAAGCIEGIRSTDKESGITVISEERHAVYCRPLISYYLENKTDIQKMNYRPEDFYQKNGCRVLYGKRAVRIDCASGEVGLDDGTLLPYDAVCCAAGSSPFVPPFDGLDTVEKKFSFMTLYDALALEAAVTENSEVLIVGAGLIGLKCAEGLSGRAAGITVCDLSDHILSSILDAECASLMQKRLEENGIKLMLGDTAVCFDRNTALMKSGVKIHFDVLVLAVGVRPNIAIVKEAGGETNRGIIVNDRMETTLTDIYAAGDCTEGNDVSSGTKRVLALLPNAYMQGYAAGVNMGGGSMAFGNAVPMNSIGFFGLHAMTAGSYNGELDEERSENGIKRFYIKDDRLKGFILIGDTQRAGIYTSLVRERTPLSSLDFDLLKKTAAYTAFSPEKRRKKFGGVV